MVSVLKTVKNTERLAQIAAVLVKHGFGEIVSRLRLGGGGGAAAGAPQLSAGPDSAAPPVTPARGTLAIRLREVLQDLGPSFVKLGQIISTRPDVIPADIVIELKKLQDSVPPMTADEVDEVLAETFGATLDETFAAFDRTPLASASIGQVHAARLRVPAELGGGERDVVVKLQRPRIRGVIERDLDLLHLLARLVEQYIPESRIYSPSGLVAEFDRAITAELDFGLEADNALRFTKNFEGDPTVRFPHPYRHASGKRMLVMERFVGSKIYEFCGGRPGEGAGPRVARNALHVVAKMIFEDGFFHADPHPGNIIMLGSPDDPVIGLIDLGLVGRLSPEVRDKAISLMVAAVTADGAALADSLLAMGKPRGRVDMAAFRAEVSQLSEKYLGKPLAEVELSGLIRDLVQGAIKYDIEMPVEMMMVGKALMTVEGIGKELDPNLDVWTALRPYLTRLLWNRYSPQRLGRDALRALSRLGTSASDLPGQVHDILDDLRAGRLAVMSRDPQLAAATDRLGRRIFTAVVAAALLAAGTTLLAVDRHPGLATGFLIGAAALVVVHFLGDRGREKKLSGDRRT
jgi:ubiquinone biosynthesis protein